MSFAIITEKHSDGRINYKSNSPLTEELQEKAKNLDAYLQHRIPEIIKELRYEGLLKSQGKIQRSDEGSVNLWYSLGVKLRRICEDAEIRGKRERRWMWQALENVYPTELIRRASRGKGRNHFEYCYRLSQFPIEFVKQIHWSEWVYFFDSKTVREEERIGDWLLLTVSKGTKISRVAFRQFVQILNKKVRRIDTSELSKEDLFQIYDSVLCQALQNGKNT
jgi:hypothetical protein